MAQPTAPSSLDKAFSILNSFFPPVVIIFLLETSIITSYLERSVLYSYLGGFILFLVVPIKIFALSGFYGTLAEMASRQEMVLTYEAFKRNAKEHWKIVLLVLLLPVLLHLLFFTVGPQLGLTLRFIIAHLDILLAYLLVKGVMSKKYLAPFGLGPRKVVISNRELIPLTFLYLVRAALFYLPSFVQIENFYFSRITLFLSTYVHFLAFLYLTFLILDRYPEIQKKFYPDKELFLINPLGPGILEGIASLFMRTYPPTFVVLKALTPKSYKTREFNRIIWRRRYYRDDCLVAITCYTSNCAEAYKIAKEFKQRGAKVVLGGPHVTFVPDEALEYCDSVVVGEAEGVWKDIIKDYESRSLKPKYYGAAVENYYEEVHRELLNSPPAVVKDFLETTRGCKFKCHFCTIPALSDGRTRKKPVEEIIELLKKVRTRYKTVTFIDNNIYSDPAYARDLFKALKPLKMRWMTQCTIDIAKNEETLRLAKESGCAGFLFGYEIFGDSVEDHQGGKFSMADRYIEFTRKVKKMGIQIKAHFIFGYDTDTYRSALQLWKFCFSIQPMFTIISLLTPLPGSKFYYDMIRENRITDLNWRQYACHSLVFRHKRMNNFVLSRLYPLLYLFTLFTTSQGGHIMLFFLVVSALFA